MVANGDRWIGPLVVLVFLIVLPLSGCISDDDGNGDNGGNGDGGEVLANAGGNVIGKVNEAVTLNASASSGPIQTYTWTIHGPHPISGEYINLTGEVVDHTFTKEGVYEVTLLVEGKKKQNDTDEMKVFVDLVQNLSGTLQNVQTHNMTYVYNVTDLVQQVKLTLTYPSRIGSPIALPVFLDIDVYAGGPTPVATTTSQTPDQGDTQEETLDLATAPLVTNEGFRVVVRWQQPPVGQVDFQLDVELYYHPV